MAKAPEGRHSERKSTPDFVWCCPTGTIARCYPTCEGYAAPPGLRASIRGSSGLRHWLNYAAPSGAIPCEPVKRHLRQRFGTTRAPLLHGNVDIRVHVRRAAEMPDERGAFDAPDVPRLVVLQVS